MFWHNIVTTLRSLLKGLQLTLRHLIQAKERRPALPIWHPDYFQYTHGRVTLQYPHEQIPVPDNGRYRLHNEIDDCIVCDKCAKICPVDCIEIEAIKSPEPIGTTSDGTVKRLYAAKFNIDMAKCCYCGLCTTVCPTECLTMSKTFDYTEAEVYDLLYLFGNLSKKEIAEKQALWAQYQAEKQAQPKSKTPDEKQSAQAAKAKPAFKPKTKKATATEEGKEKKPSAKPVFKPKIKKTEKTSAETSHESLQQPKPKIKPVVKTSETGTDGNDLSPKQDAPKPKMSKPVIKPKIKPSQADETSNSLPGKNPEVKPDEPKKKAAKPLIKPKIKSVDKTDSTEEQAAKSKKIKPVIKPKIPPKKDSDT